MSNEKITTNVLLIGDYNNAPWHPLGGVDHRLKEILGEEFDISTTEDRAVLQNLNITSYELLICYVDSWKKKLSPVELSGLLSYTAGGGKLLVIHNGISYQENPEFAHLVGARFLGHPPYQKLSFKMTSAVHPITEGLSDFEMEEELYTFELDKWTDSTVLMECTNGEITEPAAWIHPYGLGQVLYLAPGHDVNSFNNPEYIKVIKQSVRYLLEK
jgi:uncharacterized protein